MLEPGPDKHKSTTVLESGGQPINHRDASNTSRSHWRNPPTPISIPSSTERLQRPNPRPQDNPYFRGRNNLLQRHSRFHDSSYLRNPNTHRSLGNPNVHQTVLAKPPERWSFDIDLRMRKRQKLENDVSTSVTINGASTSYARSGVSEPDIQVVEPPRITDNRSNPVPNDAEIIDLGASSDDLGERVPRVAKSSSPDPLLLTQRPIRAFETHPTVYNSSASNKGKGRAKEPEPVEGSEEENDEISEFTPPPSVGRPSNTRKSLDIPMNIVRRRKELFESASVSVPVATHHPIEKGVKSIDLTTGLVINKMKKKDEGAVAAFDRVGTSSSNLLNSTREKTRTLPLKAWCLGQHLFEHAESAPLKLTYEVSLQRIRVTQGHSPPEKVEFKLDRDVCSMMIVNDPDMPLRENVVVQFTTTRGLTWKETERKYKGFKGGGDRGRGILTFLFSTAQDRGFSLTGYQTFISSIKKACQSCAIETMRPSKGASVWDFAIKYATMFEQTESRSKREDRNESVSDEPSALTRSITPCSSTSAKSGPEFKPSNGDSAPSISHRRSARQLEIRSLRTSPPPPSAQPESDEVILMYPPTGTGALNVMHSDLKRLQPEEYLNDTLIEFGLKLWLNDLRGKDPALANQIHVFSSFFYKKLNNRKNPEEGYKSVRKWTSKFDIFTKKYIIVPINENIHWYLAIIYEPGHTLEPPLPLFQNSDTRVTRKRKQNLGHAKAHPEAVTGVSLGQLSAEGHVTEGEPEVDTSSMGATRATTPSMTEDDEIDGVAITNFDRSCSIAAGLDPVFTMSSEIEMRDSSPNLVHPLSDSMDVDANTSVTEVVLNPAPEVAESSMSKPSSGIPVGQFYGSMPKPKDVEPVTVEDNEDSGEDQQQEAEVDDMLAVAQSPTGDSPSQTYIFTLDSLGTRHPQAIKVLKQYLGWEAKDKHNFDEVRDAVGKQVQVPVQPNSWDCGIYLLHFVKTFMSTPSEFVEQILSTRGTVPSSGRKKIWQDHEIPHFRDYLKSRIVRLSEEWKVEKTVRGQTNKRGNGDAPEVEALSSEGEVDIVEDTTGIKTASGPGQKQQLAVRLRG